MKPSTKTSKRRAAARARGRGLSAGTTADERKAYLQTAEKLARYMQRDMLTELEYLDQKRLSGVGSSAGPWRSRSTPKTVASSG